ncbi:HNH endonuclease [Streptomyces carpaticus]|uniref:HNH endonuclease n=1 Tax=Streptomyces cheonanensis TaxID=312720 RepID=A0ABN2VJS6_9ACTN|nr:HNH endonuclease [Streptomyces carpaticus]
MSTRSYSRERLAEAALRCRNMDEVIAFFGGRRYPKQKRYLRRRFAHFGIDITHFDQPGARRPRRPVPTTLEWALAAQMSRSIAGVMRRLGQPDNSGSRARFRQALADSGCDTSHLLGQAHGRGVRNPGRRSAAEILVTHTHARRTRTVLLRRALSDIGRPEVCAECGTGPVWLGEPMTLEVDHINGDWRDDRAENLRLLCPNCHAVTDTWCRGGNPAGRRSDGSLPGP